MARINRERMRRGLGTRRGLPDEDEERNRFKRQMSRGSRSGGSSRGPEPHPGPPGRARPDRQPARRSGGRGSSEGLPHGPGAGNISMSARRGMGDAGSTDAIEHAGRGREFLQESAGAFAEELMPGLERGLQSARSRFGGGAVRSGGAQEMEERAFERLFSDPLQNRIAQLSTNALSFGAGEAAGARGQNRFLRQLTQRQDEFNREMGFRENLEQRRRREKKRSGIGSLIGTGLGAAGGFLLGGPGGAMAGAQLGGSVGGSF